MRYSSYYPPYVSAAEKKAKAEKNLQKLKKKNPNIMPVIIEGSSIAKTWWAKAWNHNLESYADYDNRIGRGRSYVRNGSVIDLQIKSGVVNALVQGTASSPYEVTIKIEKIKPVTWKNIRESCLGEIDSLQELLMGKFPKAIGEAFTAKGEGLFPSPKEISFSCSCPDWASMCKHVAAVLYGIGARLDNEPSLFFLLRGSDMNELIKEAVKGKTEALITKAKKPGKPGRVMDDTTISAVFGIEMEQPMIKKAEEKPRKKKKTDSDDKPIKVKLVKSKPKSAKTAKTVKVAAKGKGTAKKPARSNKSKEA